MPSNALAPSTASLFPLSVLHQKYGQSAAHLLGPRVHTGLICAGLDQLFAARRSANGESREERVLCLPLRGRQVGSWCSISRNQSRCTWHSRARTHRARASATRNMPRRLEMCLTLGHDACLTSGFFPPPRFAKVRSSNFDSRPLFNNCSPPCAVALCPERSDYDRSPGLTSLASSWGRAPPSLSLRLRSRASLSLGRTTAAVAITPG